MFCSRSPCAVLFFLVALIAASATELERLLQQSTASSAAHSSVAAHATALARAWKSKHGQVRQHQAGLRGSDAAAADEDADDDYDDDDDEKSKVLETEAANLLYVNEKGLPSQDIPAIVHKVAWASQTAEEEHIKLSAAKEPSTAKTESTSVAKDTVAKPAAAGKQQKKAGRPVNKAKPETSKVAELQAAEKKLAKVDGEVKEFKDDKEFNKMIAEETKVMANETQSASLASFLGDLRTEVRQYAMPAYPAYLQGKLDAANERVGKLETELKKKETGTKSPVKQAEKGEENKAEKGEENKAEKGEEKAPSGTAGAKELRQKAGETWAVAFFANVAMITAVFAMASTENKTVSNYTWFIIDQVVLIFLAVMYFQAFDSMLSAGLHEIVGVNKVVMTILHALIMLAIVLGAAVALRGQEKSLTILCGAGAHVLAFSSIHAAAATQNYWLSMSYSFMMCLYGMLVLIVALGVIGYLVHSTKKRANLLEDDVFMDKSDDVENDFGAMAFSVVFTMFMRFLLTGHHPVDDETGFKHSQRQRNYMLVYAFACLIVGGFVATVCSKKAADPKATYAVKRAMNFCISVATMNVAWAWLYWGEWEFFEAIFPGEAIKGRVMFAITMTAVACFGLLGLAKIQTSGAERKLRKVALMALAMVVAFSWELCFDAAVEDMCEGVAHPIGWKVGTTVVLGGIIIPVYAYYMHPITSKADEAIA